MSYELIQSYEDEGAYMSTYKHHTGWIFNINFNGHDRAWMYTATCMACDISISSNSHRHLLAAIDNYLTNESSFN